MSPAVVIASSCVLFRLESFSCLHLAVLRELMAEEDSEFIAVFLRDALPALPHGYYSSRLQPLTYKDQMPLFVKDIWIRATQRGVFDP